ncbi:hypothetical protein NQ314_005363 [Rhamnusium bicolor]|uniref:Uncharacterized protein n=1 Tax=Rhamnusium bicolor TaxID=1586634 RepID=A0AAV8ZH93_9CUCU|nr:hypothetical protein NQ314_005363 [Rhamnusium bicolor]
MDKWLLKLEKPDDKATGSNTKAQGSRLSNSCDVLKTVGQEVRTRPYVHQDTPAYELDSILMYTTSLKINAKLFCLPIRGKYICFCIITAAVVILVLGQCHYFNFT